MKAKPGTIVDHINRSKLDNRKSNLRFTTTTLNSFNAKNRRDNRSGIRGVFWEKQHKKWAAQLSVGGKNYFLGYHQTIESAILARTNGIKKLLKGGEQYVKQD